MGTPRCLVPRVPPGAQAPTGSQRTVNGPLTDPLTGNGRIPPLTVNGVRELSSLLGPTHLFEDGTHSVVGGCFAFCVGILCFKTFCVGL